jgi:hypothetical protein
MVLYTVKYQRRQLLAASISEQPDQPSRKFSQGTVGFSGARFSGGRVDFVRARRWMPPIIEVLSNSAKGTGDIGTAEDALYGAQIGWWRPRCCRRP